MQQQFTFRLLPAEAVNDARIHHLIAQAAGKRPDQVSGYYILRHSIDARSKTIWINLSVQAFIEEPFLERPFTAFEFKEVYNASRQVIIIGAGPAGLFAALRFLELGVKPIILERGKDVRSRRRDLARLNKEGEVNPESNYCFGEGGAGTYSDGKLYTRSTKRGDVNRVLQMLVHFGAAENVLFEAHPHIGTNKLPQIITAMRQQIIDCGGEVRFEEKVSGLNITANRVTGVKTAAGNIYNGDAVILATGHSARDIFQLLHDNQIAIEAKPFALGVRIEHPQELIDSCQYNIPTASNGFERPAFLPPASYSLVQQVKNRGVFSFCMCPGGIIAPAATSPGEIVVNGWSPSKRNNPFANSGMVVQVSFEDAFREMEKVNRDTKATFVKYSEQTFIPPSGGGGALSLMHFQQMVEQNAFVAGGGKMKAPAQRMVDFVAGRVSTNLPACSYLPGLTSVDIGNLLPSFISEALKEGFKAFGKKMPGKHGANGYFTNEAVVVATESRTSSPVRIPRDAETLEHTQIKGLYPCGEGGGYAGGIVSAAMDGERVAARVVAGFNE